MTDKTSSASHSGKEKVDFSKAIQLNSMLAVYQDIKKSKCECGGSFFPSGPIGLKSPEKTPQNIKYELMYVWCTKCLKEQQRLYALNTDSREYRDEQKRAYADLPRWAKGESGNPIDI